MISKPTLLVDPSGSLVGLGIGRDFFPRGWFDGGKMKAKVLHILVSYVVHICAYDMATAVTTTLSVFRL